jgi:SAM-dependent methyltransferase
VSRWLKVDLDPAHRPHVAGDVEDLPVRTASIDWVLCIEVLEYVPSPERAVAEIARVLAPGGTAVLAAPFLHRADAPTDRRRFTAVGLAELATGAGLCITDVTAQGRFFTTLANMGRQAVARITARPLRWATAAALAPLAAFLLKVDGWPTVARSPFLSSSSWWGGVDDGARSGRAESAGRATRRARASGRPWPPPRPRVRGRVVSS